MRTDRPTHSSHTPIYVFVYMYVCWGGRVCERERKREREGEAFVILDTTLFYVAPTETDRQTGIRSINQSIGPLSLSLLLSFYSSIENEMRIEWNGNIYLNAYLLILSSHIVYRTVRYTYLSIYLSSYPTRSKLISSS